MINADRYLPTDAAGLPTGEIAQVSGTPFDFTTLRPIGTGAALDHNYCCANARGTTLHPMAQLQSQDGLTLHVQSSEPGLQVYAGSGLPDVQANRTFGHKMGPHAGIALEPQGWPDAPNNPQFPDIITPAGTTYRQRTRYKIIS